jgi:RNA-directed DNA polymerase
MKLLAELHNKSGVSEVKLRWLQTHASILYKTYQINKRSGGKRTIEQPTKEIKVIQRWISRKILGNLPISSCATAYHKGASIKLNARAHRKSRFTIRLDFKDFFPSFRRSGIEKFLINHTKLDHEDITFCLDFFCRYDSLAVGAPSSPHLTNVLMYQIDELILEYCKPNNLIYTRYADDMFISSYVASNLHEIESRIVDVIEMYPYAKLKLNSEKTIHLSRKYRRSITGLIITPDGRISIGRDKKRVIKALVHKFKLDTIEPENKARTRGLVAFASDVEPSFLISLQAKYGDEIIERILRHKDPPPM